MIEAEAAADDETSTDFPTVATWLDDWWSVKRDEISPTTASSWQSPVELSLEPHLGEMALHQVRPHDLESMYRSWSMADWLRLEFRRCTPWLPLRSMRAVRREGIASSPAQAARAPAAGRHEPTAPTPAEVRSLLEAAADDLDMFTFLVLAANTGARRVTFVRSDGVTSTLRIGS